LTTAINFNDNSASLDTALSVINAFKLTKNIAQKIIKEVVNALKGWRNIATKHGIPSNEISRKTSAFKHDDFRQAGKYL
jgi:serine/threonine-protein kinase HipA